VWGLVCREMRAKYTGLVYLISQGEGSRAGWWCGVVVKSLGLGGGRGARNGSGSTWETHFYTAHHVSVQE
jgi:hypothetical protein